MYPCHMGVVSSYLWDTGDSDWPDPGLVGYIPHRSPSSCVDSVDPHAVWVGNGVHYPGSDQVYLPRLPF